MEQVHPLAASFVGDGGWPVDGSAPPSVHYAAAGLPVTPTYAAAGKDGATQRADVFRAVSQAAPAGASAAAVYLSAAHLAPLTVRSSPYHQDTDLAGFSP